MAKDFSGGLRNNSRHMRYPWIKKQLKYNATTQAVLAKYIGIGTDKLNKVFAGTRQFSAQEVIKVGEFFSRSSEEVMNGWEVMAHSKKFERPIGATSERELGLIATLQALFAILVARGLLSPGEIDSVLTQQRKNFQVQNRQGAIEVTELLQEALGLKPQESGIAAIQKLLQPSGGQQAHV